MESLEDTLKRIVSTRRAPNGISDAPPPPTDDGGDDACEICGGRGWYTPEVPVGHPDFGKALTCRCQRQRFSMERLDRLLQYSNLGNLARFTFETLNPDGIAADADSRSMFAHACRIAAEYAENPDGWLVLAGPNGSGKTHLAAAIANQRIKAGQVVFFMHVPDLLDHLRSTYAPTSELTYSDLYTQVVDAPLLILDGIGAHSSTPWAEEKLQQVVNHRFNAELPTIVTTASDMADLDPYIRSRLESAGRVVHTRKRQPTRTHGLGRIPTAMRQRMTFDTFDVRGNNPTAGQRNSLEFALGAARNFASDPDGWLTLFGKTGVGKTHLAVAIGNECLRKGRQMFFAIVPDLLDYLRSAYAPNSPTRYDTIFDEITNTPLLILDDLGRENSSPWAQEKLYQIIVHRHNSRLPTVITSMLDFTEQSGPIGSRIRDASLVQLIRIDAPDWRIRAPR